MSRFWLAITIGRALILLVLGAGCFAFGAGSGSTDDEGTQFPTSSNSP